MKKQRKPAKSTGKEEVTQSEAARRLGMTPQALGVWAAKSGAPTAMAGNRRLCVWPDFPVWVREQLMRERAVPAKPAKRSDSEDRQEAAKAQLLELKLAEQQGRLMTVDQFDKRLGEAFDRVVAQAKAMKKKLAPEILAAKTASEAEVIIEDHVRAMLSELWEGADIPEGALEMAA